MATGSTSQEREAASPAEQFAGLWNEEGGGGAAEPPDVHEFLRLCPPASPQERLAVFLVDQRERWRTGLGRPVEDYLAADPQVAADPGLVGELVHGELRGRRERGEAVDLVAFAARFPMARRVLTGQLSGDDIARLTETRDLFPRPGDTRLMSRHSTLEGEPAGSPSQDREMLERFTVTAAGLPTLAGEEAAAGSLGFRVDVEPPPSGLPGDRAPALTGSVRFEVLDRLGAGGMGVVFRAFDHERGEFVALKTMKRVDPVALFRFKREFRTLADLSHPNLVNLHELIAVGDVWFFTMELVPGHDFVSHVRAAEEGDGPAPRLATGEPLDPVRLARLRRAARQLAEGVWALHQAGKLHRDVKPTNILVTPAGRVVLLDFGLTTDLERSGELPATDERVVGTVAYMSPEQATGRPLAPASDWYSVGVVLYEALTGRLPFDGTPGAVISRKVAGEPLPPCARADGVPDDLNALCMRLLRREPGSRPTGAEVLDALTAEPRTDGRPARVGFAADRWSGTTLVGRERHRAALHTAFEAVRSGRPALMLVSGRSGSGKSTLLQSFLEGLAGPGEAVVLAGRCYQRESVPYKALDSVIDALSGYLKTLSPSRAASLLPRDVGLLARMFPVLRGVPAVAVWGGDWESTADLQELRRRAITALRELLAAIAREEPLVVAIDDLHWGEAENVPLLEELLRPPDPPVMLLLASFRSDVGEASPLVAALRGMCRPGGAGSACGREAGPELMELSVGELTLAESRQLALALLDSDDPVARVEAHGVALESRGNPFFIDELVKHILCGGGLAARPAESQRLVLEEVLWARVSRLPEEARRLLEVVAVAGGPVALTVACRAADLDPTAGGREAAAVLRGARLVRGTGRPQRDEVESYHDWVHEAVLGHTPAAAVAGHHLRLAMVLESTGRGDPERLAVHYQGAGRPERAARYYARAAEASADILAFGHAARLYRLALELQPAGPPDGAAAGGESSRLRARLGDVLASAGRVDEAAAEYLAASESAPAAEALDLRRRAAVQLMLGGRVDEGFTSLRAVLRTRGFSVPSTPLGALLALGGRRALLRVRGLDYRRREAALVPAEELSLIDLCWSAGAGLGVIDPVRGADFQTRGLLRALRAGEPYRIARALTVEAASVATAGARARPRAEYLIARAEEAVRGLDLPHVEGLAALARGLAALMAGEWREACGWLDRAEPILRDRCSGVAWELNTAHNLTLAALAHLGDLNELRARWAVMLHEARTRGDRFAETSLNTYYMALVRLADDEPLRAEAELAEAMARWPRAGFHIQHASALRAAAAVSLYRRDRLGAWGRVWASWPSFRRSLLSRTQLLRVQLTEVRGRCALAAADAGPGPGHFLREARRAARALEREGVAWAAAHAVMLRAGLAARAADRGEAARLHLDAASQYEAADMRLNAIVARRRAGQLLVADDGEQLVRRADEDLAALGVRDPDAFAEVFVPWCSCVEPSTVTEDSALPPPRRPGT